MGSSCQAQQLINCCWHKDGIVAADPVISQSSIRLVERYMTDISFFRLEIALLMVDFNVMGHTEGMSVKLSQRALRDCFGGAIPSFISNYNFAGY